MGTDQRVTTCAGCTRPATAVLHDGRRCCTWCDDWRHECEARAVLAMPSRDDRRAYLDALGKRRGLKAKARLADTVRAIWEASRPPG